MNEKDAIYNLSLMIVCWVSTTFMYYLVIFYVKYLPGQLYTNQIVSGFSVFGYLLAPFMARKYDNKKIMLIGYVTSLIFLVLMIVFFFIESDELVYSFMFLAFKCGVTLNFLSLLVIHTDMFPIQFMASSYGICNIVSRLITLGAPIVAELEDSSYPLFIMLLFNIFALIATWFLRPKVPEK